MATLIINGMAYQVERERRTDCGRLGEARTYWLRGPRGGEYTLNMGAGAPTVLRNSKSGALDYRVQVA